MQTRLSAAVEVRCLYPSMTKPLEKTQQQQLSGEGAEPPGEIAVHARKHCESCMSKEGGREQLQQFHDWVHVLWEDAQIETHLTNAGSWQAW